VARRTCGRFVRSFILCDCEGYEAELFDRSVVSSLHHSDLIVELHPASQDQTKPPFLELFSVTHRIELISSRPRYAVNRPELTRLGLLDDSLVSEFRQLGQQWAVLTAKSH
jgi:hypothetical protein